MVTNNLKNFKPIFENGLKVYIETYGCQMNSNDSEVVVSIMRDNGYSYTDNVKEADIALINTCSIRDNAEQRVWGRIRELGSIKKSKPSFILGLIGCMAERLKDDLLQGNSPVDLVVGPDCYRSIPDLLSQVQAGGKGINVLLSGEETYAEISPVRLDKNGVSAYVSIMRGCNNMCTYCVVPYTRGRERSRNPQTIIQEVCDLVQAGYREVTLLGQNVNSYGWNQDSESVDFPQLMEKVAQVSPLLRVRFATSHPKDLSDKLLEVMVRYPNICRNVHLPAQSGSSVVLERMNRKYDREWYLERMAAIKRYLPDCTISTDIIAGFCGETEEDHQQTLSLMKEVAYEFAYMFKYSERPNTKAHRTMSDDVPEEVKVKRLTQIIELQNQLSKQNNQRDIGKCFEVLVEGVSKRNSEDLFGRTSQNKVAVFPAKGYKTGDYVNVRIESCSSATLVGVIED